MKREKEKDKKPRKVGSARVLLETFMLIASKLQRYEDPSSKVIQFHIMKNLTDPQPTIVRREHRIYKLLLSASDSYARGTQQ